MADPWNPEIIWTAAEVRSTILSQTELKPESVEMIGSGWDNAAFLIDQTWIFRFAQRRMAIPLLEREWRVMTRLAPRLPLSTPHPRWFGNVGEWTFLGYPKIQGRPVTDISIDDSLRHRLADPLGQFLRTLHDQPTGDLPVQPDQLGRFNIAARHERATEMLKPCEGQLDVTSLQRVLDAVDSTAEPLVLSHGDLYSRHILIDQQQKISGIIDWGDVCLAEPAHDLMLAYCFLPKTARQDFFAAYGPASSTAASRARFRAVCHTLHVHDYARSIGDTSLLAEAMKAFQFIVE